VPTPGAAGIGDRLFAALGNGGYNVHHYYLDLRYATSAPSQPIDGTVTIVARATQALSRFDLDFAGDAVGSVSVNGRPADWTRSGQELVITPQRPIAAHRRFVVRVEHFASHPTAPKFGDPSVTTAFFTTPDGSATAPQPDFAHYIYPSNDHPRDKASFTFRLDVPAGETAVANGDLVGRRTASGRTVWVYRMRQPLATELTQTTVGNFDVTVRGFHRRVFVRDVTPPSLTAALEPKLAVELEHLDWLQDRLGRYPFDLYGSLVVNTALGFALETQTLSVFPILFTQFPRGLWDSIMLHELAHQWFGDSVSPWEWSDVWLNEGHATWYENTYAAQKGFLGDDTGTGIQDFDVYMHVVYALGDVFRARYGPVARPPSGDFDALFSPNVYAGGALVLYALRQEVGAATFQRIERAWIRRYRYRSASTADFIALASRKAHRDLTGFLRAWLYDTKTPPMPGHPDWTVAPVPRPASASRTSASLRALAAGFRRR
jgi:aminopeptidase N